MHARRPSQHEIAHSTRASAPHPAPEAVQLAILVQTAREDGRTVNAAGNGAAAEGAGAAEDADAEPGAELGEEWTSEQLSNAALLVSSVLAAHAAGQPAVRSQESFAVPRTLSSRSICSNLKLASGMLLYGSSPKIASVPPKRHNSAQEFPWPAGVGHESVCRCVHSL